MPQTELTATVLQLAYFHTICAMPPSAIPPNVIIAALTRSIVASRFSCSSPGDSARFAFFTAQADRSATVISAEGYQQSQKLRGEGEAEAIRIYAEALAQDPEFYAFSRRLEAYAKALKQGDTMVVSTDADFFNYLTSSEAQGFE